MDLNGLFQKTALTYFVVIFRYSSMLAENLVDSHKPVQQSPMRELPGIQYKETDENGAEEPGVQSKEADEDDAEQHSGFGNIKQKAIIINWLLCKIVMLS